MIFSSSQKSRTEYLTAILSNSHFLAFMLISDHCREDRLALHGIWDNFALTASSQRISNGKSRALTWCWEDENHCYDTLPQLCFMASKTGPASTKLTVSHSEKTMQEIMTCMECSKIVASSISSYFRPRWDGSGSWRVKFRFQPCWSSGCTSSQRGMCAKTWCILMVS